MGSEHSFKQIYVKPYQIALWILYRLWYYMFRNNSRLEPLKKWHYFGTINIVRYCEIIHTSRSMVSNILGVEVLNNFYADVGNSVKPFNCKHMRVYLHFKCLQCDVLSKMIFTCCLDASQYGIMRINVLKSIMWHDEKQRYKFGSYLIWLIAIYYLLLQIVLQLYIILEKRLLKRIWSIINSESVIENNVSNLH